MRDPKQDIIQDLINRVIALGLTLDDEHDASIDVIVKKLKVIGWRLAGGEE